MELAADSAHRALRGVGDATLGQWHEAPRGIVHLRRRLTMQEQMHSGTILLRDIRGTAEQLVRWQRVRAAVSLEIRALLEEPL